MASPVRPYRNYRIRGLPEDATENELQAFLSASTKKPLEFISLGRTTFQSTSQIGTATFRVEPGESLTLPSVFTKTSPNGAVQVTHIDIDDEYEGFTPLNASTLPDSTVDIIAITGMGGKAFASWQCPQGSMWLRDFLPRDFPNIRVFIYGYSSALYQSNSNAGLLEYAKNFLLSLLKIRRQESDKRRPLVLVGHSLGCLIIKKIMVLCAAESNLKELQHCIFSVVLFGAPHRGLNTEALASLVRGKPSENLIRDLTKGSTALQDLNESFASIQARTQVITCYELRTTPTAIAGPDGKWERTGPEVMMVESDSACLYTENEFRIPINENHSMIAKLSDLAASHYHTLKDELGNHVRDAPAVVRTRFLRYDSVGMLKDITRLATYVLRMITPRVDDKPRKNFGADSLDQRIVNILIHEVSQFSAFQKLVDDERLGKILSGSGTALAWADLLYRRIQRLYGLFSMYRPLLHNLEESRPNNTEALAIIGDTEDNRAVIGAADRSLFREGIIIDLITESRDHILKMRAAISFGVLGMDDFDSMEQLANTLPAKETGVDNVALRHALLNRSASAALEECPPLSGQLQDPISTKTGLSIMNFVSENGERQQNVIVEYRSYASTSQSAQQGNKIAEALTCRQFKELATLLQRSSATGRAKTLTTGLEPVPCTFRCLGHLEESDRRQLALIFEIPPLPPSRALEDICTLRALIDRVNRISPKEVLPLEQRFLLARNICLTVLTLHSSGWVHKDIRSHNIVLVPAIDNPISKLSSPATDTSRDTSLPKPGFLPYLKGFEFSRRAADVSTGTTSSDIEINLYRHPQRQGLPSTNFTKEHDIYALGVVLYEIGTFKTVRQQFKSQFEKLRVEGTFLQPEDILKVLIRLVKHDLPKAMGTKYTEAVLRCLNADFGFDADDKQQTRLGLAFQELVLEVIEGGLRL